MAIKNKRGCTKKNLFKRKMRFRKFRTLLICTTLLFGLGFCSYKIFVMTRCKDLNYAVEHFMTSNGNADIKLMRVQTMKLVFSDGKSAVVEVFGMGKSEPHATTSIKGHYKKNSFDSWVLEDSYLV